MGALRRLSRPGRTLPRAAQDTHHLLKACTLTGFAGVLGNKLAPICVPWFPFKMAKTKDNVLSSESRWVTLKR